ncbi:MAG: two-component regulator propeller domain-containing protein [Crocinitomicaceae bacterium]
MSFSQDKTWEFQCKSIADGLSNTYVSDIMKDSKGFVWVGTHNGLNKFNG